MTLTDELKILDGKIKANQAQYDSGREASKIPALPSNKRYDEFEEMSLNSKYKWINEFTNLTNFKNLKPKKPEATQKGANYEKC